MTRSCETDDSRFYEGGGQEHHRPFRRNFWRGRSGRTACGSCNGPMRVPRAQCRIRDAVQRFSLAPTFALDAVWAILSWNA